MPCLVAQIFLGRQSALSKRGEGPAILSSALIPWAHPEQPHLTLLFDL